MKNWLTSSSAMHFTKDGKILIAWYLYRADDSISKGFELSSGEEYEGKLRIGQYDYLNDESTLEHHKEMNKYFG